jgi:small subunit ribosomal protein S17e
MGNIRTKDIKKASFELIGMYPERFGKDFEANKQALKELKLLDSKIVRNKIAGYITRAKKRKQSRGYRRVEKDERGRMGGRRGFGGRGRGGGRGFGRSRRE